MKNDLSIAFDQSSLEMDINQSASLGFSFKGDGINYMDAYLTNNEICDISFGTTDFRSGRSSVNVVSKNEGETELVVRLLNDKSQILFQQSIKIKVNAIAVPFFIEFNNTEITLNEGENTDIDLKFGGNGIYTFGYSVTDPSVASVEWGNVDYSTGEASFRVCALKSGSTEILVNLLNSNYEVLYGKTISVNVNEVKPFLIDFNVDIVELNVGENSNVDIKFEGDGIYTIGYDVENPDIATIEWGNVDYSTGDTSFCVHANNAGETQIIVKLLDSEYGVLYEKPLKIMVNATSKELVEDESVHQQDVTNDSQNEHPNDEITSNDYSKDKRDEYIKKLIEWGKRKGPDYIKRFMNR